VAICPVRSVHSFKNHSQKKDSSIANAYDEWMCVTHRNPTACVKFNNAQNSMIAVGQIVFRLRRFKDVALLTDG
jgi:hypothetical protein